MTELGNTHIHPPVYISSSRTFCEGGITLRNHMIVEAMKASISNPQYGVPSEDDMVYRAKRIIRYVDTILEQASSAPS